MTDQERQQEPMPTPAQSGSDPSTGAPKSPAAGPAHPGNVITLPTAVLKELQRWFVEQERLNLPGGIGSMKRVFQETALERLAEMGPASEVYRRFLSTDLSDDVLSAAGSLVSLLDESSLSALRDYYAQIDKLVDEATQRWEPRARVLQPYFEEADFWVAPSMSHSLLDQLLYDHEQGQLDAASLQQVIVEEYRRDHYDLLRIAVESWRDNDPFSARMPIIEDALQAHIDGKFTLSVPALLPHIEGIVCEILGSDAQLAMQEKAEQAIKDNYPQLAPIAEVQAILRHLGGLYANFVPLAYQQGSPLNRHAILHGVELNYARVENSLRVFLILDVLSCCV